MEFDPVRRLLLTGLFLLALTGCQKEAAKKSAAEEGGAPQVATSLEDYALPVDRSDQITAIDAATGDPAGMPKDGGAVIVPQKAEARPAVEPAPADAPPPTPIVAPPPPAAPSPASGE